MANNNNLTMVILFFRIKIYITDSYVNINYYDCVLAVNIGKLYRNQVNNELGDNKNETKMNKPLMIAGVIFVGIIAYFVIALCVRPTGPFDPLVSTDYFFDQTGTTKELIFNPHFCKNHEIALIRGRKWGQDLRI